VESLREQLRERGYLSHGIERWFALDPWSSRAFWAELATVAAKAATLVAVFAALPCVAIMIVRNHPLSALETLEMFLVYAIAWGVIAFCVVVAIALLLKNRPELAIDTPRALLAISMVATALLAAVLVVWWYEFDLPATLLELAIGGALGLIFFVVSVIVVSAALLSFTIYELRRIPAIHQKPRGMPLGAAAAVLAALLFIPAYAMPERHETAPLQVVTTPMRQNVALIAVDGLSDEIFRSRPDLAAQFATVEAVKPIGGASTTERWASVGTGVPAALHGVRAVEGVRLAGGPHILQSVSHADFAVRLAGKRQPLPPTIRRRDFVWEIFAARAVPSLAVNWWTSPDLTSGALTSVGQDLIFGAARGNALAVDYGATRRLYLEIPTTRPRFATVYLPALDVILNRVAADPSARLSLSIRALDGVLAVSRALRQYGYDVIVVGLPGDRQSGNAIIAATIPLGKATTAFDVAPTLCDLAGFPGSQEMPGHSLVPTSTPRIASYGSRLRNESATKLNDEYYQSLRSLGYIR